MKFCTVTTFPNNHFEGYAKFMVKSYLENWENTSEKDDASLLVVLDQDSETNANAKRLESSAKKRKCNIAVRQGFDKEFDDFVAANKDKEVGKDDYRHQGIKFAHKVFAISYAAEVALQSGVEYLVWLDADVITSAPVKIENILGWTQEKTIVTYLGRKDWNCSETGFILFDLKNGAEALIRAWKNLYTSGKIYEFEEWTDAYAFDRALEEFEKTCGKKVSYNLSEGIEGRDVFEASPLGKFMTHYKGNRKNEIVQPGITPKPQAGNLGSETLNVNNMGILTRNCVPGDNIKENVTANLQIIQNWLVPCSINDEEVVIASAGPSLDIEAVKAWYDKGVKIVAVKHVLERLLANDIIPWACILLDPRPHVGDFVQYPNKNINWFVASMVDPSVTDHLKRCGVPLYGYHAGVGAEEQKRIPSHHKEGHHVVIEGGSATSTRGISVLEALGFTKFHLYGYDCSYPEEPDLSARKENGKLKYDKVTLECETWGGVTKRTFWTEGQFLAQVQEFKLMYLPKPFLELNTYGDGIIPWVHKHFKRHKAWMDWQKSKQDKIFADAPEINKWLLEHGGISKSRSAETAATS